MVPQEPSLGLHTEAGSCPQAVGTAHPTSQTSTPGTGQSTRLWGDAGHLLEQEQYSNQPISTANKPKTLDPTLAPDGFSSHHHFNEAWDALDTLAMTAVQTDTTDLTTHKQQSESVAHEGEWVAMATKPSTDTTLSVTVLSRVPDMDTPLTTARSPPDHATTTYTATDLPSESTQRSLHRSPSLPSLASTPSSPARSSTLHIDSTTALLPQTSSQSLRTDLPASLPFQTSSQPLRIDLTTSPPRQTRQQLPYLDAASTAL